MAEENKTKKARFKINWWFVALFILGLAGLIFLLFYRLSSIMPGITANENSLYSLPLGFHGLYHEPLNLPLNILWSIVFKYLSPVSIFLLRLPDVITGATAIIAFYILLKIWFNLRTATIGTVLFATSAWTLHVSRLATLNVEYLAAITIFLLSTAIVQKKLPSRYTYWLINLTWGMLLYVPGMVFFIGYNIFRQRLELMGGMKVQTNFWSKLAYVFSGLFWLPLLLHNFINSPKNILSWLALPQHFASPWHILKNFGGVFYHIFIRGPLLPDVWLGRTPILDIFSVVAAVIGLYFYITHIKATRTHLILISLLIGAILIALGGSATISIVMPIIYILIATGLAYLLSQWLNVFPKNPFARSLGYLLIGLAITASVVYNVRDYFVAWPHNQASVSVFDVKAKD